MEEGKNANEVVAQNTSQEPVETAVPKEAIKKAKREASHDRLKSISTQLKDDYHKKQSILLKISLLYLLTTSMVLAIFLVASSSNQMGIIAEKAIKTTDAAAYGLFRRLEPLFSSSSWSLNPASKRNQHSIKKVNKLLKMTKESKQLLISNFKIISSKGDILHEYQYNPDSNQDTDLKRKTNNTQENEVKKASLSLLKKLKKALKFKDIKGQLFLGIPNIEAYYVEIVIPIAKKKDNEGILFYTQMSMSSLKNEVNSIMRLAYGFIGLVLFSQLGLVYFLYRTLLVPIKRLAKGAHRVAEGDLKSKVQQLKQADELGQLTYLFNKMVLALDERTEKLNLVIQELEKRNEIMQNELDMARNIQEGIMPSKSVYDKINFSIYYSPLEKVSGDYYDFFALPNGSLGILITDASGHGVPAALVTIMAKVHFNDSVNHFQEPGDLLEYVNRRLVESIITSDYMTAFYLILDPDLKLRYSNASHQKALVLRHGTKEVLELDSGGFFIGALDDVPFQYENKEMQLQSKDRVILYTDGIVEGTNPQQEEYSTERFIGKIKEFSNQDINLFKDNIVKDVDGFAQGEQRRDDYTLLIIEVK